MDKEYHDLKCQREYFQAIADNKKTFEVRIDDRSYKVGDWVNFQEKNGIKSTGREVGPFEITYILSGDKFGIKENWCVFSFK